MHKYRAKRTKVLERTYSSKLEASYAQFLDYHKSVGDLWYYLEQVPFRLTGGIMYRLDFLELWNDGTMRYTETKGFMTPAAKIKLAQVQEIYQIEIQIVTKAPFKKPDI